MIEEYLIYEDEGIIFLNNSNPKLESFELFTKRKAPWKNEKI